MRSKLIYLLIFCMGIIFACNKKSEYRLMVEKELSKGVRHDSLFLGYELGMSRSDFYSYSWDLNKKKLVRQGPSNSSIEYELEELPHPATMYYYPEFKDDKVYLMKVVISYDGWAPWNPELGSDSLQVDVVNLLENWHGTGFIERNLNKNGPNYVKVDGNREISVSKMTETSVSVIYKDLLAEQGSEQNDNQ